MEMFTRWLIVRFLVPVLSVFAQAAEFSVKVAEAPPPREISDSIRASLGASAIRLMEGDKPLIEIWPRKDTPVKAKPAALDSLAETTLVGVIAVREKGLRDYKDNEIPAGVFTARFGLQPQDGDHLGTAEFSYFLVLIGADVDGEVTGIDKYRPMVKASGKLTPSGHPLVLSLRPAGNDGGALPAVTEPAPEHKAIRMKIPVRTPDGEATELPMDLVFQGHGHIQ